jgi:hypothetical protein
MTYRRQCLPLVLGLAFYHLAAAEEKKTSAMSPKKSSSVIYRLEQGAVLILEGERQSSLDLPAKAEGLYQTADALYVALGEQGLAVYRFEDPLKPQLVQRRVLPHGSVVGLFMAEGQLWMKVVSTSALPLSSLGAVPLSEATPLDVAPSFPQTADAARTAGPTKGVLKEKTPSAKPISIVKIMPGVITLNVGSNEGVEVGQRFAVFHMKRLQEGQDRSQFEGKELAAVVKIIAVKEGYALAELGRGERVSPQDTVVPAGPEHSSSTIFPKQLSHLIELATVIRPLINIGKPLGLGFLCDLFAAYYGPSFFVDLRMQPLGFGWTKEGNVVSTSLLAEGGYDARPFGVGLGVGFASVNGNMDYMLEQSDSTGTSQSGQEPPYRQKTHFAFALSQQVRLGSRDGLHLLLYNILLFHQNENDDRAGFIYGGTSGRLAIPLSVSTDLFLEGGGGLMGYAFGAFGLFTWLVGNGDDRSFGISASAGGATVWGSKEVSQGTRTYDERVSITGPMVSLGLTYRKGL